MGGPFSICEGIAGGVRCPVPGASGVGLPGLGDAPDESRETVRRPTPSAERSDLPARQKQGPQIAAPPPPRRNRAYTANRNAEVAASARLTGVLVGSSRLEARVGIEPTYKGFADLSLTTWVPRPASKLAFGRQNVHTLEALPCEPALQASREWQVSSCRGGT